MVNYSNPYTLESLISNLDSRGLLVLQVLLGQQAMKELEKSKVKEVVGISPDSKLILPGTNAKDLGSSSLSTQS